MVRHDVVGKEEMRCDGAERQREMQPVQDWLTYSLQTDWLAATGECPAATQQPSAQPSSEFRFSDCMQPFFDRRTTELAKGNVRLRQERVWSKERSHTAVTHLNWNWTNDLECNGRDTLCCKWRATDEVWLFLRVSVCEWVTGEGLTDITVDGWTDCYWWVSSSHTATIITAIIST